MSLSPTHSTISSFALKTLRVLRRLLKTIEVLVAGISIGYGIYEGGWGLLFALVAGGVILVRAALTDD